MKLYLFHLLVVLLTILSRVNAQDASAAKVETRIQLMFHNQYPGSSSAEIFFNGETVGTRSIAGIHQYAFSRTVVPGTKNVLHISKGAGIAYSYAIIANGYVVFSGALPESAKFVNNRSSGNYYHEFVLSEKDVSLISGGTPLGMELEPEVADLEWAMSLGDARNGEDAGYLAIRDDTLGVGTHLRSNLAACLSPTAFGEFELIHTDENNDGFAESLRQIMTKRNLIDVVDLPNQTGYQISVREWGTRSGSSGPYTPSGATLVTYEVERVSPTLLRITRNEPGASRTIVTEFEKPATGSTEWILRRSGGGVSKQTEVQRTETTGGFTRTWTNSYVSAPAGNPSASSQFVLQRVYANLAPVDGFQPTPRLIEETTDPGVAGAEATTVYSYYDDTAAHMRGVYGLMRGMKGPYGDWKIFEYYNFGLVSVTPDINNSLYDDAFYDLWRYAISIGWYEILHPVALLGGSVKRVYRTGGDDFPVDLSQGPEQFSGASAGVDYIWEHHSTGFDWDEITPTRLNKGVTYSPSNVASERYNSLVTLDARMPTLVPINHSGSTSSDFVQVTRDYYNHTFAGNWIANSSANTPAMALSGRLVPSKHDPGFDYRKAFKPWYAVARDNAKTSYAYQSLPTYRGIANAWCEFEVTGTQVKAKDNFQVQIYPKGTTTYTRRVILFEQSYPMLEGPDVSYPSSSRNSTYGDLRPRLFSPVTMSHAFEQGSGAGSANLTLDDISLISGKSTKTARIYDPNGNLRYIETWARVGSEWKLLSLRTLQHDAFGRVVQIDEQRGQGAASRTIYEADHDGLLLSYTVDASGLRTDYHYDGLGRSSGFSQSSRGGSGAIPGIGQSSLTYATSLDCLDRVVETRAGGVSGIVVESASHDFSGRLRTSTDRDGVPTSIAYSKESGAGLRIDVSKPEGITQSHIHHQNGKLKSSTGTGLVAQYYQHGYGFGSGNHPFVTSSAGDSAGTGPQSTTRWNWLGQTTAHGQSTSVSAWNESSHTYLSTNARLNYSIHTEVSENGSSTSQSTRTIYEYDGFGSLTASGVDVNANSSLNDSSTDLITRGDSVFVLLNGQVSRESTQKNFTTDNNSSAAVSTTTRTQLTGLASDVLSDTTVIDIHGNETRELVTVERDSARITSSTSFADGTSSAGVHEIGFPKSQTHRHGETELSEYDAYGRLVLLRTTNGDSSFATSIVPEPGKLRPWKIVKDLAHGGSGNGRAFEFGYDQAGRQNLTILPDQKVIQTAYDTRGLVVKKWGNGTRAEWFARDPVYGWLTDHHKWQSLPGQEPDLATATQPPADSTVTHYAYFPKSGQVSSQTLAYGTTDARITSFTYDAVGNLRSRVLPGATGGNGVTATSPVTVTMTWHPKTSRLTGISYNDTVTTDLAFTHSRAGTLATVTEKPNGASQITRTLHHNLSGNGNQALHAIGEDLPGYYQTIPGLASNDTAHTATRIVSGRTSSATKGRLSSVSLGTAGGSPGLLAATRMSSSYDYQNGLLDTIGIGAAQSITYGYESSSGRIDARQSSPDLSETIQRHPLRNAVSLVQTVGGGTTRVSHQYSFDGNGRRKTITRTGSQFAGYGGKLHEVIGRSGSGRIDGSTTHAGSSASSPVLPGRGYSYEIDGSDNLRSIQRPNAPGGESAFDANPLDEFRNRQNSAWEEIAGLVPRQWNVAIRDPLADGPLAATRVRDYFHAWKEIPGSALRGREAELLAAHPGSGGDDPANPGEQLDRLITRPLSLLARPSSESISYDARGNLTADALWTYTWDAANRLIAIESTPAAIAAGKEPVKLGFRYDWLGRRYMKEHFTWTGSAFATKPAKVTLFWWDGWNLLREASYNVTWGSSNPTAASFLYEVHYHRGPDLSGRLHGLGGIGGLVATQRREAGQTIQVPRYPAYDGNGNIVAMLDGSGTSVAEFEYDPYGRTLRASGEEADQHRIRFATQYHDVETGLYYHQFRYYDPGSGRFLSRDPAGASGNFHPYAYADNDPVRGVDPFGLAVTFHFSGGPSSSIFSHHSSSSSGGGNSRVTINVASNLIFRNAFRRGLPSYSSRPAAAGSHIGDGTGHAFDSRADLAVVSAAFGAPETMDPRYSYRQLMELGQQDFRLHKTLIAGQIFAAQVEGKSDSMQFGRLADELEKMGPGYENLAADARGIQHNMQDGEFDYSILSKTGTGLGMIADMGMVGVPPIFTAGKIGRYGMRTLNATEDLVGGVRGLSWNPVTGPGPLGVEIAKTFRSATYTERVLEEPLTLYRVYGGKSGQLGPYWTATKPSGGLQSQLDSALLTEWGNTATNTSSIIVPRGTTIFEGFAAPQTGTVKTFESLMGGGHQIYIPRVDPSWLIK